MYLRAPTTSRRLHDERLHVAFRDLPAPLKGAENNSHAHQSLLVA